MTFLGFEMKAGVGIMADLSVVCRNQVAGYSKLGGVILFYNADFLPDPERTRGQVGICQNQQTRL